MSARPESPMMRTLRQLDYDAHQMRCADLVLHLLGFLVVLLAIVSLAITIDDLGRGRDPSVLAAIRAFLDALDAAQ